MWGMMVTTIVVDLFKCTIKGSTPNFLHSKKVKKKRFLPNCTSLENTFLFQQVIMGTAVTWRASA